MVTKSVVTQRAAEVVSSCTSLLEVFDVKGLATYPLVLGVFLINFGGSGGL